MTTLIQFRKTAGRVALLVPIALAALLQVAQAAVTVGSTAPDFTIRNHATGQPLRLYNYQGNVLLLDFWAYWCGPCQSAAADMEPNIVQYYRNNSGNTYGVPVQVISISVDLSDVAAANNFIQTYGLELVGDDTSGAYWTYGDGYIPYMVVVNGTTNSTNHRAWEVLHSTSGYDRTTIKTAIDSVQTVAPVTVLTTPATGAVVPPPDVSLAAAVTANGKIIKRVEFYEGTKLLGSKAAAPYSIIWSNAPTGTRTVFARAFYGATGKADSLPVTFTVGNPPPIASSISVKGGNLELSWSGGPGMFRVQMTTSLNPPAWVDASTSSTNTSFVIGPSNSAAFYRIVRP